MFLIIRSTVAVVAILAALSAQTAVAASSRSDRSVAGKAGERLERLANQIESSAGLRGWELAQAVPPPPPVGEVPVETAPAAGTEPPKAEIEEETPTEFSTPGQLTLGASTLNSPDFNKIIPEFSAKDAEFQNVIRLLALKTGMNILLDPNEIKGQKKITFQLRNVTVGQALKTILRTNQIGYIVEDGNIVRLFSDERKKMPRIETETEVLELNWRQALDLEKSFQSFVSKAKNDDGTAVGAVKANEETQSLIVTDTPSNLARIKELVRQIDRPDRQVLIEARLVDVQVQASRDFKAGWSASKVNRARLGSTSNVSEGFSGGDAIGGLFNILSSGAGYFGGEGIIQLGTTADILGSQYTIDAALSALENRDVVEVLATPRVTTLNNVLANIAIIQKIPYTQGEIQGQTIVKTFKFEEVGQTIGVKPIISKDGHVRLDIDLKQQIFRNRAISGDPLSIPVIDERTAKSTVIVKDRNTVVLGGLRGLRRGSSIAGVPWMHRIPLIGWLFKDKGDSQQRNELVLMVTPNVVQEALIDDTEKEMYDRIDVNWHLPDYFFDDVSTFDDTFDRHD